MRNQRVPFISFFCLTYLKILLNAPVAPRGERAEKKIDNFFLKSALLLEKSLDPHLISCKLHPTISEKNKFFVSRQVLSD